MRFAFLKKFRPALLLAAGAMLLITGLLLRITPASAIAPASPALQASDPTRMPPLSIGDEYCLGCHGQPGQTLALEDGSTLDLFVDPNEHANSVHGQAGYACVQCHRDVGEYPHPAFSAQDRRDVTLKLSTSCTHCHHQEANRAADSVHARAIS